VTDDSAFKRQVRARMAETGEKYTEARRIVIEDAAIRELLHRYMEPAGISRIEIERTRARVRVDIWSAHPGIVIGRRGEEADLIRASLMDLTGTPVQLNILEVRLPLCPPGNPRDHPCPPKGAAIQSHKDEDQRTVQRATPGVCQERHGQAELR
jgi:hypothetical protein